MQRDYIGYLIALASVIIGVYVSWYYYEKSVQQRQPIFAVDVIPSTVYDTKQEMRVPLKVTREDGKPLTKSVHVASHIFWNAGTLPVVSGDVLTPIRISLTNQSSELLAVSVVKQSRGVATCAVKQDSPSSFQISFRILEQDDGCQIRVFYAGPQSPGYKIDGEIIGVKKLAVSGESVFEFIERTKHRSDRFERFLSYVPMGLLWIAILVLSALYLRTAPLSRKRRLTLLAAMGFLALSEFGIKPLQRSLIVIDSPVPPSSAQWVAPSAP
jgi:hypothetical protein